MNSLYLRPSLFSLAALLCLLLAAGCAPATPAPQEVASQTAAFIESVSTPTTSPPSNTPVIKTAAPTSPATITNTPEPIVAPDVEYPQANIVINSPGSGSIVSPSFFLTTDIKPGDSDLIRVELFGEDGRSIMRTLRRQGPRPGSDRVDLVFNIDYEIEAAAELGRLEVAVEDDHGRTQSLASVDLLLLSEGPSDIDPNRETREKIIIQQPPAEERLGGGSILVSGLARVDVEAQLNIMAVTESGRILDVSPASLVKGPAEEYAVFVAELDYVVIKPTLVRISVQEKDDRIRGNKHISSLVVQLLP